MTSAPDKMRGRTLRAIVLLPGVVVVFVPGMVLWATATSGAAGHWIGGGDPAFWIGLLLGACGLALAVWTMRLFFVAGGGTLAPWDPTDKLVVQGPYRHVRNPMIGAVFMLLAAEALLFDSWPIGIWLAFFYLVNAVYIPRVEERGLEKRFGDAWRHYAAHVPRWFPSPLAYCPATAQRQDEGGDQ